MIDRICDKIETPDPVICVRGICSRLTPICYRGAAEVADWSQLCADAEDTDYRSGVSILSQILNLENDTCMSPIVKGNQVYNIFNLSWGEISHFPANILSIGEVAKDFL